MKEGERKGEGAGLARRRRTEKGEGGKEAKDRKELTGKQTDSQTLKENTGAQGIEHLLMMTRT